MDNKNFEDLLGKFPDARVEKALEHERELGRKQKEDDALLKRMESDLFKSSGASPKLFGGRWA